VKYIDAHYPAVALPTFRAITGLSMGGHGGMWLGIRHTDVFAVCGSMSGGVDIRPFPTNWEINRLLGDGATEKAVWNAHTVATLIENLAPEKAPKMIIDCGEDDFFIQINRDLHASLLAKRIDHDFITRPGAHNSDYWNNAIDYQLLFFEKAFRLAGESLPDGSSR
jgi:S-formylglutathione hydrolase FrmB